MNIRFKSKRYRLGCRFFIALYVTGTIFLSAAMTLDFEQRMNKPHGEFFVPVSEVSFIGYKKPLGEYKITFYCPCEKCCGKSDGVTASGTVATEGRTIAVDPDKIQLGSKIIIDDQEYVAEDKGGAIHGNKIDIFVNDHETALSRGSYFREVFKEEN